MSRVLKGRSLGEGIMELFVMRQEDFQDAKMRGWWVMEEPGDGGMASEYSGPYGCEQDASVELEALRRDYPD